MLEIGLRTTGDRSFLIGGLKSAILDLLGDLSKSDDLDSISISILEKNDQFSCVKPTYCSTWQLLEQHPRLGGASYLGLVWDIFCSRVRVIPSIYSSITGRIYLLFNTANSALTTHKVLPATYSSTAVAAVNSSTIDNAVNSEQIAVVFHFPFPCCLLKKTIKLIHTNSRQ